MAARAISVITGVEQAAAALEPTRLRLLGELSEPAGASAADLARRLGLPRQRVNYHLRELEKARLVELVEERRKGNCVERIVRAVARSYLISPGVMGDAAPKAAGDGAVRDRLSSAYLIAASARTITDVAELRARAERAGKSLSTLTIEVEVQFASAADRNAFAEDLASEVAKLAAEYHDESAAQGRLHRFVVGGYPAITKPEGVDAGGPEAEGGAA
jgi:DNA-binding transcriptional ArsR family regulator